MLKYRAFYLLAFAAALIGCGTLGLQQAQTFEDRAGYAIGTHTAVLESATQALDYGDITSDEAEGIADLADDSRELIDTARDIKEAGDAAGADKTLALSVAILERLQSHLRETRQ